MNKENIQKKTRQRTLVFVAMFTGFLGTSIFAGINVFAALQKNQDFSQVDAEEKFSRLPEYLLDDLKLLKDKDFNVRNSAIKALGDLRLKKAIPELIVLLRESKSKSPSDTVNCATTAALAKLELKEAVSQLISSLKKTKYVIFDYDFCITNALQSFQEENDFPIAMRKTKIPEKAAIITDSNSYTIDDMDRLNKYQIIKIISVLINELEKVDILSDLDQKSLTIDLLTAMYLKSNQKFKGSAVNDFLVNQSRQVRDNQWVLTGFAATASFFSLLLTLFCLQELQRIAWKNHLICYFPDEVVGELIALRRELTKAEKSTLFIETKLFHEVLTLIWAFYIQINIENLWLPSKDQRRR
jgi:HEAT repeats